MATGRSGGGALKKSSNIFFSSSAVNGTPDCLRARYCAKNRRAVLSVAVDSFSLSVVLVAISSAARRSSGAGLNGSLPRRISSPSGVLSLSVSGFLGSVPQSSSSQSFRPSLSASLARIAAAFAMLSSSGERYTVSFFSRVPA